MKNRIKELRKAQGLTLEELSKRVNISIPHINKIENHQRGLEAGWLEAFGKAFNVSPIDILEGPWNQKTNNQDNNNEIAFIENADVALDKNTMYVAIPLMDMRAAAGPGYPGYDYVEYIKPLIFELPYIRKLGNYKETIGMFVEGASMEPILPDGALILVDKSNKAIWQGKIYLVRLHTMLYVKYVEVNYENIVLKSANPDKELYPNIEIPINGIDPPDFEVLGRVIWYSSEA